MEALMDVIQRIQILRRENPRASSESTCERIYVCPLCRDLEYVEVTGEDGIPYMRECECRVKKLSMRRIERSGLKDAVNKYTFENYKATEQWQKNAKMQAMKYVEDHEGKWFYIGGQVGAGKTHLCTAIVSALIDQGLEARYMTWRDEIVTLKALVTKDEEYRSAIEPLKTVKVLYIDDFFKTERGKSPTSGDINIAFELLNYRYINGQLITIISCERDVDEVMRIDEAVGSRIYERTRGNCVCIDSKPGRNYRLIR